MNNLFGVNQHGFRRLLSCETALNSALNHWSLNCSKKLVSLVLFIDFKKAFDMVNSDLLIWKLVKYGFSNQSISLLSNYFHERSQITKIGQIRSSKEPLTLGVPQGSVLGPLLFIIFINDLIFLTNNKNMHVILFADDTTVSISSLTVSDVILKFKLYFSIISEWVKHNLLEINWAKTKFMFLGSKNSSTLIPENILIGDNQVEVVNEFKLLGITLDSKLSFTCFTKQLAKSVYAKLFTFKKLFYLTEKTKLQFFKTFILIITL
jgi:hypothetical protein